jgi:hypothetical protein
MEFKIAPNVLFLLFAVFLLLLGYKPGPKAETKPVPNADSAEEQMRTYDLQAMGAGTRRYNNVRRSA